MEFLPHYQEIRSTVSERVLQPSINTLKGIHRWGVLTIGGAAGIGIVLSACGPEAPRIPTTTPSPEGGTKTPTTIIIETPTAPPIPTETTIPLPSPSPSPRAERVPATPTLTLEAKEVQRRSDIAEMREMFSAYAQNAPNKAHVLAELNRIEVLNQEDSKRNFTNVHTGYTNGRPGSFVQSILLNPSLRASRNQSEDVMHIIKDLDPSGKVKTKIMKFWVGANGVGKMDNSTERSETCISSPLECVIGSEVLSEFSKQNDSYVRSHDDKETIIRQTGEKILIIERYDRNASISPGWL